MRRRFVAFLGGAPVLLPIIAAAQPTGGVRRVGVVIPASPGLEAAQPIVDAIQGPLPDLGWSSR